MAALPRLTNRQAPRMKVVKPIHVNVAKMPTGSVVPSTIGSGINLKPIKVPKINVRNKGFNIS